MAALVFAVFLQFLFFRQIESWNDGGSVLLRDVQALTLYRGRYTTARRTSPVLQLQCVGGSAGCGAFMPEVVQCQNKGWDGVDVQWECKTDMDNAYRFGKVEVSCEGFNHPDDPYILKGSCGLEYTLELTGQSRQGGHGSRGSGAFDGFAGFASSFFRDGQRQQQGGGGFHQSSSGGDMGGLIVVGLLLLLAYGVYKMFLCGPTHNQDRFPDDAGFPSGASHTGPPPAGFKPDYSGSSSQYGGHASYPGSESQYGFREEFTRPGSTRPSSNSGYGFWSGLGTGGVLGYLFGNQNRRQPNMHTGNSWNSWIPGNSGNSWNSWIPGNSGNSWNSWIPGNSGNSWNSSKVQPGSTGTRTASGFGGTKRR